MIDRRDQVSPDHPSFLERYNRTMSFLVNNRGARNSFIGLMTTAYSGFVALPICFIEENKFPTTSQCIMAEMPKCFAYGCSALGIIAGTYILAKRLYPQLSINMLRDGLDSNFRQLQNAIQRTFLNTNAGVINPQIDSIRGDNSQNGEEGGTITGFNPSNSTTSPSAISAQGSQNQLSIAVDV